MARTLQYHPALIDELITNERMNSYRNVFQPTDDVELMGVYLWNAHVCSAIYPLIGMAEITLRNSIDREMRIHHGCRFWWSTSKLQYNSITPGTEIPKPIENIRRNFATATNQYLRDQKDRYNIQKPIRNHHGIVAKTEFSTWEFLLSHELLGDKLIWPSRLGKVFTGPWPSSQAAHVLTHAQDLVSAVRKFRNRLFHHEPAWKRFGVYSENDALQHLKEKIGKVESLMMLINPESLKMLEQSGFLSAAYRACTSHEIRRFQALTRTHKIKSINKLSQLIHTSEAHSQVLQAQVLKGRRQRFLISPI